jgi:hypothetical protein
MSAFTPLLYEEKLEALLYTAFGVELRVSGGWGYSQEEAMRIDDATMPLPQLQHSFALCRAYLEMHMRLSEEERYGSINLNEKEREELEIEGVLYHCVKYEISAMKESLYKGFIEEYKRESERADFDMKAHFARRKEATLSRVVEHWFEVSVK